LSNKKAKKAENIVSVGGEALMEGIMMRGPEGAAVALRMPDGSIETTIKKVSLPKDKFKPFGWPIIRGPVDFVDSMVFGYKCLMESAEKTGLDFDDNPDNMSKFDKWIEKHFGPKMMSVIGVFSAFLGLGLAFGLFFWLPSFIFDLLNKASGDAISSFRTIIEGAMRILIFVTYMILVSQMNDIKRVFMYHGAEHKSIFCYEKGEELTVDNVRKQIRFHPRCGTSFIFVMVILSILISSIVAALFPILTEKRFIWMIVKIMLIPIIMSIGYEFIRYAGRHDNIFVKIAAAPGLWMQRITTKEPTDDIIEVGIASLKAALGLKEEPQEIVIIPEEESTQQQEEISDNSEEIDLENNI